MQLRTKTQGKADTGMDHEVGQLPEKGKTCMQCKKIGHFARACLSSEKRTEMKITNEFPQCEKKDKWHQNVHTVI